MLRLVTSFAFLLCASSSGAEAQSPPANSPTVAWTSSLGRIIYASESGGSAVLEYPLPFGDNIGRFYVNGLAGEFGGPGPLDGYWSEPDVSHDDEADTTLICPFAIIDDHGRTTRNWGRLVMMFTQDDFPGDFVILRGRCFENPADVVAGKLLPD